MEFSAVHMAHVPGTLVLIFLVLLLFLVRRRYPGLDIGAWLVATCFLPLPELAWFLGATTHPLLSHLAHCLNLFGQMSVGIALLFYERAKGEPRRMNRVWVLVNYVPLLVFSMLFGFYVSSPKPYVMVAVVGILMQLATAWWRRVGAWYVVAGLVTLLPAAVFAWGANYRMANYWIFAVIYAVVFLHMRRVLPVKAIGRLPILASLSLWSLFYITHAWALNRVFWRDFADGVWSFERYLLTIGMLLVLMEDQVSLSQNLAMHDALTGLPNRRSLMEWLESAIRRVRRHGGRVTLLLVDLNGFKKVNDTYGHAAGDHLLHVLAGRMRTVVGSDDLLVRLGGDEFVLASARSRNAEEDGLLEERLRRAIEIPVEVGGESAVVSGSFGVAVYPDDTGVSAEAEVRSMLLKVADQRMYRKKVRGEMPPG